MKTAKRAVTATQNGKGPLTKSYNEVKSFNGQQYTGMKIGRSHKWYYDKGEWKERKVTPDLWQFDYAVTKRRAGRAPEGSGVPVGTEYDWYIAAHQTVTKLNANDYTTSMTGLKYKVAHKRAGSEKWSATENARKKRLVKFLRDLIDSIERGEEEIPSGSGVGNSTPAPAETRSRKRPKKPVARRRVRASAA